MTMTFAPVAAKLTASAKKPRNKNVGIFVMQSTPTSGRRLTRTIPWCQTTQRWSLRGSKKDAAPTSNFAGRWWCKRTCAAACRLLSLKTCRSDSVVNKSLLWIRLQTLIWFELWKKDNPQISSALTLNSVLLNHPNINTCRYLISHPCQPYYFLIYE